MREGGYRKLVFCRSTKASANEAALLRGQIQHPRVPVTANPRRWPGIAPARSSINRRSALMDSARTIAARSPSPTPEGKIFRGHDRRGEDFRSIVEVAASRFARAESGRAA